MFMVIGNNEKNAMVNCDYISVYFNRSKAKAEEFAKMRAEENPKNLFEIWECKPISTTKLIQTVEFKDIS
jgi:hypothetical protein